MTTTATAPPPALTKEAIIAAALSLPRDERVDVLLAIENAMEPDPEVEAAWLEECHRRLEAYDRGEMEWVDGDELIAKLQRGERP